jgi:hypothetical protein
MATSRDRPLSEILLGNTRIRFVQLILSKNSYCAHLSERHFRCRVEPIARGPMFALLPVNRYPNEEEEMVRFLRESTSLESVWLHGTPYCGPSNLGSRFLSAIAENSNVRTLNLGRMSDTSVECFISLLQTTTSITSLVRFGGWAPHHNPSMDRERLARAVSTNQTLESIRVSNDGDSALEILVLSYLGSHRSLQELIIDWYGPHIIEHIRALVLCLQSTKTLKRLEFAHGKFTSEVLDLLVDGLRENQTVTGLCLNNCTYESIDPLLRFMHSGQTTSWSPCLRELTIRGGQILRPTQPTNAHIASLLNGSSSLSSPTVGSCLHTVEFQCIDGVGWDALIQGLPRAVHLRKLVIEFVLDGSSTCMARAVRENGSLHFVSILKGVVTDDGDGSYGDTYFRPTEHHLVASYCQRNECLPTLLASTGLRNVWLPTLLGVAAQAARLAPNNILIGLLSSSENVGPGNHRSKRLGRTH